MGFSCRECDDQLKKERGCTEKGIVPFDLDGDRVFRCPLKMVSSLSWDYLKAYSFFRKNMLPNGSSYLKESDKYIEAMFAIDKEYSMIEESELKKVKK